MGKFKEYQEDILRENFILKFIGIIAIIYIIISIFIIINLNNDYNSLYKEAEQRIEQDNLQIKELTTENNNLKTENQ